MHRRLTGNGSPRKLNVLLMFKSFAFSARRPLDAVLMLVSCLVLLLCSIAPGHAADDFLDPAVAFKFSATEKPGEIDVRYKVADGYYMYRERFAFAVKNGNGDAWRTAIAAPARFTSTRRSTRTWKRIAVNW